VVTNSAQAHAGLLKSWGSWDLGFAPVSSWRDINKVADGRVYRYTRGGDALTTGYDPLPLRGGKAEEKPNLLKAV